MSSEPHPRPRFDQRAFAVLEEAHLRACAEVAEVEAVLSLVLYRLPTQNELPSLLMTGADGTPSTPDTLGRLAVLAAQALGHLAQRNAEAVLGLQRLASELSHVVRGLQDELVAIEAAPAAPGGGDAPDGPHT